MNKKLEKKEVEKKRLINKYKKIKSNFINIEKEVAFNFHSYAYNEIIEIKQNLDFIQKELKKVAKILIKFHRVHVDIETREIKVNERA